MAKILGIILIILFGMSSFMYASPNACRSCVNDFHNYITIYIKHSVKLENYKNAKYKLSSMKEKDREEKLKQDFCALWLIEKLSGSFKETEVALGFNISCISGSPRLKSLHLPRHHSEKKAFKQWDDILIENANNFNNPIYSKKGINEETGWYEDFESSEILLGKNLELYHIIKWFKISSDLKTGLCGNCHDPLPKRWAVSYSFYSSH